MSGNRILHNDRRPGEVGEGARVGGVRGGRWGWSGLGCWVGDQGGGWKDGWAGVCLGCVVRWRVVCVLRTMNATRQ